MDGETPETLGYRGAQYVRADVVEGRVREAVEKALKFEREMAFRSIEFEYGTEAAETVLREIDDWKARVLSTRPALASPSDSSGDDEGGKKG